MFEDDSADTSAKKIPLVSMGGWAEGLACADPGARTPIGASGNLCLNCPTAHRMFVPHIVLDTVCKVDMVDIVDKVDIMDKLGIEQ